LDSSRQTEAVTQVPGDLFPWKYSIHLPGFPEIDGPTHTSMNVLKMPTFNEFMTFQTSQINGRNK
jgi:hypothetical protein